MPRYILCSRFAQLYLEEIFEFIEHDYVTDSLQWVLEQAKLFSPDELEIIVNDVNYCSIPQLFSIGKVSIFNTEQFSRKNILQHFVNKFSEWPRNTIVYDYSTFNQNILQQFFPYADVRLLTETKISTNLLALKDVKKEFDFGHVGTSSERRNTIISALRQQGFTVHQIDGLFGRERDAELAKCRCILNLHYADDYWVFEKARCCRWIAIGVPVLTEESHCDDNPTDSPFLNQVSYESLQTGDWIQSSKEWLSNAGVSF
jgi:hypothetical protein